MPHTGRRHIFFDACTYRFCIQGLNDKKEIKERALELKRKEKERDFYASGFALVLWELVSHLLDTEQEHNARACRKALLFAYHHIADTDEKILVEPLPELGIAYEFKEVWGLADNAIAEPCTAALMANSESIAQIVSDVAKLDLHDPIPAECQQRILAYSECMRNWFKCNTNSFLHKLVTSGLTKESLQWILDHMFNSFIMYAVKRPYWNLDCSKELYPLSFIFIEGFVKRLYDASRTSVPIQDRCARKKLANNFVDAMHLTVVADRAKANQCIFVSEDKSITTLSGKLSGTYDFIMGYEKYLTYLQPENLETA